MPRTFWCRTFGNTGAPGAAVPPGSSHHYEALLGVVAGIQALGLGGISGADPLPAARVVARRLPGDRGLAPPYVTVSYGPGPETAAEEVQNASDWGYPCLVAVVVANNQDPTVDDAELRWRQQIRDAFHERRPAQVVNALSVPVK